MNTNTSVDAVAATEPAMQGDRVRITGLWWNNKNGVRFLSGSLWPGMKLIVAPASKGSDSKYPYQLCWVPFDKDKSESDDQWPFNRLENRCISGLWPNETKNGGIYFRGRAKQGYLIHVYMNKPQEQSGDSNPPDADLVLIQDINGTGQQKSSDVAARLFQPSGKSIQFDESEEYEQSDELNGMFAV